MTNYPGGGNYPQAPAYGAPVPQGAPARPQALTYAVGLMYAGSVLAVLGGVVGALSAHSLVASMITQFQSQMPSGQPHPVLPTGLLTRVYTAAIIAGGVIDALLWLWMAWKNRAGRSWARVLSTVLFGFLCLSTLSSLTRITSAEIGPLIMGLVGFAVGLSAVILMWRPESSLYYQAVKFQSTPGAAGGGYGYPPPPAYGYGYGSPQSAYGHMPPAPPAPVTPPPPEDEVSAEPQDD